MKIDLLKTDNNNVRWFKPAGMGVVGFTPAGALLHEDGSEYQSDKCDRAAIMFALKMFDTVYD